MTKDNLRQVYSDESGRICPDCSNPASSCICTKGKKSGSVSQSSPADGIVRLRREVNGRGGKTVIVISGIPLEDKELKEIGRRLKKVCGTGGSVKNGIVEIQGEHREKLMAELEKLGYSVKAAGG